MDLSDHTEVDAQKQRIKDFLKGLTRPEKLIVVLYYYDEMTIKEIAKVLDLSEACISQIIDHLNSEI